MLNEQTIRLIQSTVPVLEQRGQAITRRFYELLFAEHPELLNVFNHAHQKMGRQQAALANAVYAAALHIDKLETILPAVRQIAHKHRSLGVKAEHYPIVGQTLLAAIKDVLGEAASEEVLAAWAEAYGVIACAFIGVEAGMYREAEEQAGGWAGFRPFKVTAKVRETEAITSFYLMPADGGALAAFEPGQYVSVKMALPGDAFTHIRQYSLSDAPGRPYYRITVKREDAVDDRPAGRVSTYLHERVAVGDELQLSAPAGAFTLDRQAAAVKPVVLISGGVGQTPLVSMLAALAEDRTQQAVTFIHAAHNGRLHALRRQVEELAGALPRGAAFWCYEQPTEQDRADGSFDKAGRIDLAWLASVLEDNQASFYLCGPEPFMRATFGFLREWGVAESDIHYEFFGPTGSLAASPTAGADEEAGLASGRAGRRA
ncbi:NO-inducible flavohemoprotein [Paenibacillus athensensis]|uniref:Flavohemoprotein n=1 Tax=Paenibacillus athensensis TaxID=1967502 RepID=A0A4Y8PTD4_9BACL|nr:NO-inducible flavohemoprotein [Paenibacillus athensensis]MCD1261755.1 NO-inducible flavohemoprotein [Paenibacillus athensensis]